MKELLRTNDIVTISYVEDLLLAKGIAPLVFDENFAILDGSLGILPRRIMVIEEDHHAAKRVLIEAGLKHELSEDR